MTTTTKPRRKQKSKRSSRSIYQEVTDQIVTALEEGTVPWQRPWKSKIPVPHMNLASKKAYRGINPFMLDLTAMINGYELPYWVTFKQAKALGGHVRKDEKSTIVVFNKRLIYEDKNDLDKNGKPKKKPYWMLKYYRVFNVAQCEGLEDKIPVIEEEKFDAIEAAERIGFEMENAPTITHGGNSAHYMPQLHSIRLPDANQFFSPENYYTTKFHELGHSTGNEQCLGRVKDWTGHGSDPYAKEELVAEMCATMLARVINMDVAVDNTAAYIANWLGKLKGDPKLVVQAASQAQRAADYIQGIEVPNND